MGIIRSSRSGLPRDARHVESGALAMRRAASVLLAATALNVGCGGDEADDGAPPFTPTPGAVVADAGGLPTAPPTGAANPGTPNTPGTPTTPGAPGGQGADASAVAPGADAGVAGGS